MLKVSPNPKLWIIKTRIKDTISDVLNLKDNVNAYVTITVKDKDGKIISQTKFKSHSFVYNGLLGLYYVFTGNHVTTTMINGSLNSGVTTIPISQIMMGSGTKTPNINDYNLTSPIPNGTGSGELTYESVQITNPASSGDTGYYTITQQAINNSGAPITVTEVGLYASSVNTLVTHDLLPSAQTVPANGAITVTYTISVTT